MAAQVMQQQQQQQQQQHEHVNVAEEEHVVEAGPVPIDRLQVRTRALQCSCSEITVFVMQAPSEALRYAGTWNRCCRYQEANRRRN